MAAILHPMTSTVEEFRAFERLTQAKLDYRDGAIQLMPGARKEHTWLQYQMFPSFGNRLHGRPCEFLGSETQVSDADRTFITFPDGLIACPPIYDETQTVAVVLNPTVIFEVLSPSTAAFDRGDKFDGYRRLPSLRDYVLLESDRIRVEIYRAPDWRMEVVEGKDAVLSLPSVALTVPLAELYRKFLPD